MGLKNRLLAIGLLASVFFSGCSGNTSTDLDNTAINIVQKDELKVNDDGYLLVAENGRVALLNTNNEVIDEIELTGTVNSDYIFCSDEGTLYTNDTFNSMPLGEVFYGVDKTSRKMTIFAVRENKIVVGDEHALNSGNIISIHSYCGMFCYETSDKPNNIRTYSYNRNQILTDDGDFQYTNIKQLDKTGQTYINILNLSAEYMNLSNYAYYVDDTDKILLNFPAETEFTIEIPTNVNSWTSDINSIYFFNKGQMGKYSLLSNLISVYDGYVNVIDTKYVSGPNAYLKVLADFGKASNKTIIADISIENMNVANILEIENNRAVCLATDKQQYLTVLFKTTDSTVNFAQLRSFNYENNAELYVTPIKDFQPTQVVVANDTFYLINPYEEFFLTTSGGAASFKEVSKYINETLYRNLFSVGEDYRTPYLYDNNGRLTNKDGQFVDVNNNLIDANYNKINENSQLVDALGRAINSNGELIDTYNNVINEKGQIVKLTKQADGGYLNSNGEKVDADGTLLVKNDNGEWVRSDEIKDIEITGHYDENGNFIIDADVLDKYPNAYDLLN